MYFVRSVLLLVLRYRHKYYNWRDSKIEETSEIIIGYHNVRILSVRIFCDTSITYHHLRFFFINNKHHFTKLTFVYTKEYSKMSSVLRQGTDFI